MISGERPKTVSKALWELADWLDEADRLIDRLAAAKGIERHNSGDDIQTDMRRLSRWFHEQPECDAHAMAYLKHFDDDEDDQ